MPDAIRGPMERKKRYNQEFLAWIERKCQEGDDTQPVNAEYYESFVSLTNKQIVLLVRLMLHETSRVFHKKLVSGAWKSDDEMYEFVMVYLELFAEGRLAFDEDTGKMLFFKPAGDPPSDEMWDRIQKRITSSRSAIRAAIVKSVKGTERNNSAWTGETETAVFLEVLGSSLTVCYNLQLRLTPAKEKGNIDFLKPVSTHGQEFLRRRGTR